MAQRVRSDCINKPDRNNPHRHITHIGGPQPTGTGRDKISEEEAIQRMKTGELSFYVHVGLHTIDVVIAVHLGREYLKTVADGYRPDNLLALPECP